MKNNGNNIKTSNYYLGLDVGTDSLGWAVTNEKYNIEKFKSKAMWGIRQFPKGESAAERRSSRTNRRRMQRKKQRLKLLEMLFENAISHIDPLFFERMKQSSLYLEDRDKGVGKYALFNDENFSDIDYQNKYKTIYHLRKELACSDEPHDVRLVFLALHHIMKKRGHFLYESTDGHTGMTMEQAIDGFIQYFNDEYNVSVNVINKDEFIDVMSSDYSITQKKKTITSLLQFSETADINCKEVCNLLAGSKVTLSKLFNDESLKDIELKSYSLKDSDDEQYLKLCNALAERMSLVEYASTLYDTGRIYKIMGDCKYISEAKVNLYEQNRQDLLKLKEFVKEYYPIKYKTIFSVHQDKLNNYVAYSRYKTTGKQQDSSKYTCKSQEDFCTYLKKELPKIQEIREYNDIAEKINDKTFLTRLASTENGLIPYQLNRNELIAILDNASRYLDFLNIVDDDGLTIKDKIVKIFEFRVPYYVGPLSKHDGTVDNHWVVRMEGTDKEKIYPWNFDKIVDTQKSAEGFIIKLIGKCTYTGEKVLPKHSLLFSEYSVLNEINPIKINGNSIPVNIKQELYTGLFINSNRKVTKKRIKEWLLCNGYISKDDEISGINDTLSTSMKSYHDFKNILERTGDKDMIEDIIKHILIYCDDKKMLKDWLTTSYSMLSNNDVNYILKLKYNDWGRLSKEFLTEIYHVDEQGEAFSVMDMLRNTNLNLMQLLSNNYQFLGKAEQYRKDTFGDNRSITEQLDDMYISPSVRRSILQTLKVVDEIVDVQKSAPKKIFIEMARDKDGKNKKVATKSRKEKLLELYKGLEIEYKDIYDRLVDENELNFRKKTLYLYYMQLGKCMYSGDEINLDGIVSNDNTYDIDHIFPQSKIMDDSFDNKVLVRSELNREKLDTYPIDENIRSKMSGFWKMLKDKGFISEKKYDRLKRNYPLTQDELSAFVARQLVETRQATKALATVLQSLYPESRIVYSKAENVSDFKSKNKIVKCREVNDLHHAKDAYLNAVVGNVYDTKFTTKFFNNIYNEKYSLNKVFDFDVKGAWDTEKSMDTVKATLQKNNILTTTMTFEQKGELSDTQILGKGKGQLEIKKGKDIDKYGGYNNVKGAYFCTVEHSVKKNKRQVSIEPVYIYSKALFESNPTRYCEEVLGLAEPKVIVPRILNHALIELDGKLLRIRGRQGKQNIYQNTYQLILADEWQVYINRLLKYISRYTKSNTELEISEKDGISREGNIQLYDVFLNKLKCPVYNKIFKTLFKDLNGSKEKFENKGVFEQSKILREILMAFKCNRKDGNLKEIGGSQNSGKIVYTTNLTKVKSAYMINQSPTGLYEVKIPLK